MKKLFISQPMRGKTDEEILKERERAIKHARDLLGEPVAVADSFFQEAPIDTKPLWYLGESLKVLADADVAYFFAPVVVNSFNLGATINEAQTFTADFRIAQDNELQPAFIEADKALFA